jgi:hypothetical protein
MRQQKFDIFGSVLRVLFPWILKAVHVRVHEHDNGYDNDNAGENSSCMQVEWCVSVQQFDAKTVIVDVNVLVLVEVDGFWRI